MTRDQFSYWLRVSIDDPNVKDPEIVLTNVLNDLRTSEISDIMTFELEHDEDGGGIICGEVNPNAGTTEEDASIIENVAAIAAKYPCTRVQFDEIDEDDKSYACSTEWLGGVETAKRFRRVIEPGEYDEATIEAISAWLSSQGHPDLAAKIRNYTFTQN